jgi:outer membrane protein assembly factor BamB
LYIIDINNGTEKWSYEIGAKIISCPAVAGGKIIIGADDGNIYAFGESG